MAPRSQVYGWLSEHFKIHCEIDLSSGREPVLVCLSQFSAELSDSLGLCSSCPI